MLWIILNYSTEFIICDFVLVCWNNSNVFYTLHERIAMHHLVYLECVLYFTSQINQEKGKISQSFSLQILIMKMDNNGYIERWRLFLTFSYMCWIAWAQHNLHCKVSFIQSLTPLLLLSLSPPLHFNRIE